MSVPEADPLGADRADEEQGPERRCILTATVRPKAELLRFVVGPDGRLVPDLAGRLPGRGIWLSAGRDMVNTATAKGLFAKAARRKVLVSEDLADRIETLLVRRCLDTIGLARRAGGAVAGFEKVKAALKAGQGRVLIAAADGAKDGREKLRDLAPDLALVALLSSRELAGAFGREHVVHALLAPGRLAETFLVDAGRLAGFRS